MKKPLHPDAFSLVEVTLALGVAALSLIAIFGLLPVGMSTDRHAIGQSIAMDILSAVSADLRGTPNTSTTSTQFNIPFGASTTLFFDETGNITAAVTRAIYRLTVAFPPNVAGMNAATFVDLKITWPAALDPATSTPAGSVEAFGAFDRH